MVISLVGDAKVDCAEESYLRICQTRV